VLQVSHADVYAIRRCMMLLFFWVAMFVALMFTFMAQFSWFPWIDKLTFGTLTGHEFFRQCAPSPLVPFLL
jgi:hypothetical protein